MLFEGHIETTNKRNNFAYMVVSIRALPYSTTDEEGFDGVVVSDDNIINMNAILHSCAVKNP
jgi:hypothetical protein